MANLILRMTSKDIALGQHLADCRYAPKGMVNEKRENKWLRSGYVRKVKYIEGKETTYYLELTKKGREFLRKNSVSEVKDIYTSKRDAKLHDICLSKERTKAIAAGKLWFNEQAAQNMLEDRVKFLIESGRRSEADRILTLQAEGKISAPDGITYDPKTGMYEVVEITTRNYKTHEVEAKFEYARSMNFRDDFKPINAY